jgi:hypothetical protein
VKVYNEHSRYKLRQTGQNGQAEHLVYYLNKTNKNIKCTLEIQINNIFNILDHTVSIVNKINLI